MTDVIVLGGGAAGLMCAIQASQRGKKVVLLEHQSKVGKKILISGGGRCNFTNRKVESKHYRSNNKHFCKSALSQFTNYDFIAMVEEQQIPFQERKWGQLFCQHKSSEILEMLLFLCHKNDVNLFTDCHLQQITKEDHFKVQTNLGVFSAPSLVVATGGLSIPAMGATGIGYEIAKQFGLEVTETTPGLVPFTFHGKELEVLQGLSGTSFEAEVSCNGQSFQEAVLFTHHGLSGPAILQISNYWEAGDRVTINCLPQWDLSEKMNEWKKTSPKMELKTLLSQCLTKKHAQIWIEGVAANKIMAHYSKKEIQELSEHFHSWTFVPSGTRGYKVAEVTRGGVSTEELSSKTMESKKVQGLFFIGEVVDVTGWLGGYNFQWAWSSGFCAGQSV